MKKKIFIALGFFTAASVATGLYLVWSIETTTARLDDLIRLHRVAILRETFLIRLKRVQSDLILRDTRHSRGFETMVRDVVNLGEAGNSCFRCHHDPPVMAVLRQLNHDTERYKDALSRVLTIRANASRLAAEEDAAIRVGEELIRIVGEMLERTNRKLEERTAAALSEIDRAKVLVFFLLLVSPAVSAALGIVLVRGLTRPVERLVEAIRKVKGGDLDHRVTGLRDEFRELESSFNEMAQSLREQVGKMQRTEQLVAIGELAAGLAHEIKDPLAGIKVAMDVLLSDSGLPPEDREVAEQVMREVARLEGLMRSFLHFTRPPKPQPASVKVNDILDTTLSFFRKHRATASGLGSGVEVVKDFRPLPETFADPMQVQQVCLNLFLNALDAMPHGGTLHVATSLDGNGKAIRIDVSDTGTGVDKGIREKIFEPFFTTKGKGTGLGLPISRQLMQQHGGAIEVSDNPGGGARFTVRLPVVAPPGTEAP